MLRQEIRVDPFQSESLILHANSQQTENECDCGNPILPPSLLPLPVHGRRREGGEDTKAFNHNHNTCGTPGCRHYSI